MTAVDSLRILPAGREQLPAVVKISTGTFYETFAADNSKADMDAYLSENFSAGSLGKEMDDGRGQFYLARVGDEVAGYLKLKRSDAPPELAGKAVLEIERVYVLKAYQSQKVGAALMQFAIGEARRSGAEALWLGVWEHNHKALAFYKKWGFEIFGSHGFQLGSDLQTDLLMSLAL
jgi:diamine N-acetyltransferase